MADRSKAEKATRSAQGERATTSDPRTPTTRPDGTPDGNPMSGDALADNAPGEAGHATDPPVGHVVETPNERVEFNGKSFSWHDRTGNASGPSPDADKPPVTPDLHVPAKAADS